MIPSEFRLLADHLWQSTLFVAVAGLLTLTLRQNRAKTRYFVWLTSSVKFLVPFSLLVNLGGHLGWKTVSQMPPTGLSRVIDEASQPFAVLPMIAAAPAPLTSAVNWFPAVLFSVWAIGFCVLLFLWWRRWQQVRVALRAAQPLDLAVGIQAMVSPTFAEPGVFGVRRPILLLPAGITERLTPLQFHAIVAHELCHLRRRDNLAAAIHMVVESVFWFHPLVWWLGARLVEERERACDEEVLLSGSEPQDYAGGILKICELYLESPLPCVSGVTGSNIRKRIVQIMSNNIGAPLSFARKSALMLAGVLTIVAPIVVGVLGAPPVRAQSRGTDGNQAFDAFEVAAIKPTAPDWRGGRFIRMESAHQLVVRNHVLRTLVAAAYNVNPQAISGGPAWIDSEHFDIIAKSPGEAWPNTAEQMAMLRNLLANRFKLTLDHAKKDLHHYALVQAKNGPKLKVSRAE